MRGASGSSFSLLARHKDMSLGRFLLHFLSCLVRCGFSVCFEFANRLKHREMGHLSRSCYNLPVLAEIFHKVCLVFIKLPGKGFWFFSWDSNSLSNAKKSKLYSLGTKLWVLHINYARSYLNWVWCLWKLKNASDLDYYHEFAM